MDGYARRMRFVIFGAGAVGGVVGGFLALAGEPVALIARGEHRAAIDRDGLRLRHGETEHVLRLPVFTSPADLGPRPGDVVLLAVKSQDTQAAMHALAAVADPQTPIVCLQNGVANERTALRHFANVYGVCVMCPASHLTPGVVSADSSPTPGILHIGRTPSGTDDTATVIAAALRRAGFVSEARPDIARWKYTKLLTNLGNAVQAVCGPNPELAAALREEARRVLDAAGIDYASEAEDDELRGDILRVGGVRGGGSSWQSLARHTGAIEADYLNGEIVLLGREHGIATRYNENARRWANIFAREHRDPATLSAAEWRATLS
jgi:2-dehydropantoate 2-reductase